MKSSKFKLKFKGDEWLIFLHSDEEYLKLQGTANTDAVTYPKMKQIHFTNDEDSLTLNTVSHELFHMAFSYQYLPSAEPTPHQVEEVSAELFATEGAELIKMAKKVFKELKRRAE